MLKQEVLFKNFSDKSFSWKHDGQLYTFKAGSATPMARTEAVHFSKHLIDQVMNDKGIKTNHFSRVDYEAQCIEDLEVVQTKVDVDEEEPSNEFKEATQLPTKTVQAKRFCEQCTSKGVRHMKDCPTNNKEFEDLKENAS